MISSHRTGELPLLRELADRFQLPDAGLMTVTVAICDNLKLTAISQDAFELLSGAVEAVAVAVAEGNVSGEQDPTAWRQAILACVRPLVPAGADERMMLAAALAPDPTVDVPSSSRPDEAFDVDAAAFRWCLTCAYLVAERATELAGVRTF